MHTLRNLFRKLRIYFALLLCLTIVGVVSYQLLRIEILNNMQDLGNSVARSYSLEKKNDLWVYKTLISYTVAIMDEQTEQLTTEPIQTDIQLLLRRMQSVLEDNTIDPYVVYHGEIIGATPWVGDPDYDYSKTQWYQMAMASDDVIFTDVYIDAVYNIPVVTTAQKCKNSDTVVAFDIILGSMLLDENKIDLPKGTSFFLCDTQNTIVFSQAKINETHSAEEVQAYVDEIMKKVDDGSLDRYDAYLFDPEQERRGVYYFEMYNGWTGIVTIPYSSALSSLTRFTWVFLILIGVCLAAVICIGILNYRIDAKAERSNEVVKVLGNLYYAIYRINYAAETYEMIKGSGYIRDHISETGTFDAFIRTASEVIDPHAKEDFIRSFSCENIRNLVATNIRDFGGDFRRMFDDGEYRWVNVRVLFEKTLAPNEVILCFKEIEDDKIREFKQRELLENALESARKNEKAKQAFFSSMSHDMRTPLNAIIGFSSNAQHHVNEPDTIKDYLNKIGYSAQTLLNLVNDILEMSRLEQGKLRLSNTETDIVNCVTECCSAFAHQAEQERKQFSLHFEVNHKIVLCDPFRITQILNNLLSNALKYTASGDSISVTVKQMEFQTLSKYQIIVKDTGIGMSEEFLPTLFEPYTRETRFHSRKVTGTGLGMPIVKSIVVQMSGEIHVESELGHGTTFFITIPFLTAEQNAPSTPEQPVTAADFSLKGRKILLAEDNELNMEVACEILQINEMEVVSAWNGLEALRLFEQSNPYEFDAILMDMQMPEMDGCEAAKCIRMLNRPDAASIPIIAVTANAFAEDVAATSAAGMNGHISKPIDVQMLYQTLEKYLQQNPQSPS